MSLSVRPDDAGEAWHLRVEDTGRGMSPEVQARLFDPFFTTKPEGHGLGMAAVLGIVRAHGGQIQVDSTPGAGATFDIRLPASRGLPPPQVRPAPAPSALRTSGRILVVDDEELIRTLAQRLLSRLGFEVALAEDGERALAALESATQPWACLLMDLSMPKLSGAALYREVRARDRELPILLSSGRPPEWAWEQEDDPRLAFIAKPYRTQALVDALSALMASRATDDART